MYLEGFVFQEFLLAAGCKNSGDGSVTTSVIRDKIVEFPKQLDGIGTDGGSGKLNTRLANKAVWGGLLLVRINDQNFGGLTGLIR